MRILHLNDHAVIKGGVESYLHRLLPKLQDAGDEVLLAHGGKDGDASLPCVHIPGLSSPRRRDEKVVAESLAGVIRDFQPDCIHVHNTYSPAAIRVSVEQAPTILHLHDYRYICPASSFYFRRIGRRCGIKCSAACFAFGPLLGCQTPRPPQALGFYRRVKMVRSLASKFRSVIANSNFVQRRFVDSVGELGNTETLHYFLHPPSLGVEEGSDVKKSMQTDPYVLFVGRVREDKGIFDFIRTVAELKNIRGKIIGARDEESVRLVRDYASHCCCNDRIDVENWLDAKGVKLAMKNARALLFPSRWDEPFGLVGVEALLQKTPVVATDVGGVRDWLEDGIHGFLVPVGDTQKMAARVQQLEAEPELRYRMGKAGYQSACERFAQKRHVSRLRDIYQGV